MTIIDFHTHFFPEEIAPRAIDKLIETSEGMKNYTDGTLSGLISSMKQNGVTHSVTLPVSTKPPQVQGINRSSAQLKEHSDIIPFGTLHPEMDNWEQEIDFLVTSQVKGIKLHPEYQYFYIDDKTLYPIYDRLSEAGIIVVFHTGKDPGPFTCDHALPEAVKRVRHLFPKLKMVAAHMGGWKVWERVEEVLCGENIWFDTSAVNKFMPQKEFVRLCRKHGTENILFGSDSPWYDVGECIQWVDKSTLSSKDKELIFEKNASFLLGLSR
ncbi:amidohydrolase family protein [Chitinispirillales bacterium ANBcel5]|uniref:amidohydrolase family protein n=1 Tax=Cellulosispirillum alkaliphilum TaxID=3039283 RepID=UPI002A536CEE|nr:amidohydrolase family protein [Chitinispirillales bacterium ANBcel5]